MHAQPLPPPDPELALHSEQLRALIHAEIDAHGPIAFSRYMELALYAPGLGYYSAGLQKFGHGGDFITAPELGPIYAQTLARVIAPVLRNMEQPTLLDVGGGSGRFAVDLWQALEHLDALPERYWLLERSADLRERQIERLEQELPQALPRIAWLDEPPKDRWDGVLVANEVVDALPVDLFEITNDGPVECVVENRDGRFRFAQRPLQGVLAARVRELLERLQQALPTGWRGELLNSGEAWLHSVAGKLRDGMALLIDYGEVADDLYHPQRQDGSLRCYYRHRVHGDPFWYPGLCDLSASVDFSALALAADQLGFDLAAYDTQSAFLRAARIDLAIGDLSLMPEMKRIRSAQQLKTLMLPNEMGERFKVMALTRHLDPEELPEALTVPGQRHRL